MITGTITAKQDHKDMIIEQSQYLIEYTRLKPCCVSYQVYTGTENKVFLWMVDHWKNTEVLEVNMQNEHFNLFCVAIEDIIIEKLDIGFYSVDKIF